MIFGCFFAVIIENKCSFCRYFVSILTIVSLLSSNEPTTMICLFLLDREYAKTLSFFEEFKENDGRDQLN